MDFSTLLFVMAMVVVGMAWYGNSSKRNKIYCSFTRVNKTSIHKFVRMASRYVVFDSRRFDIIQNCIVFDWWDKGLVHMFFPQWVATLNFTYASRWPIDPSTGKHAVISPEVREAMNKEEWAKAYHKTYTPPSAKKQTAIQQFLPWIAIGLVALLFFYVYTNNQAFTQALEDIANRLKAIAK